MQRMMLRTSQNMLRDGAIVIRDEYVAPSQWRDYRRASDALSAEQRLLVAIFEHALDDLRTTAGHLQRIDWGQMREGAHGVSQAHLRIALTRRRADTIAWFLGTIPVYPFSFEFICAHLPRFDVAAIRDGLERCQWRPARVTTVHTSRGAGGHVNGVPIRPKRASVYCDSYVREGT